MFFIFLVLSTIPFAETLIYPGFVEKHLHISPILSLVIGLCILICYRFLSKEKPSSKNALIVFCLSTFLTLAAIVLRVIEFLHYPNYIYTHFHIDPTWLGLSAVYLFILALPLLSWQVVKRNIPLSILFSSFLLYHLLLLRWVDVVLFTHISYEDNLIEYLTFAAYFFAAFVSFFLAWKIKKSKLNGLEKNILCVFFLLIGLTMFAIAGEEISWGQRILNIKVPDMIAQQNRQKELNIHNNTKIFPFVYYAYGIINFYGLLSWTIYQSLKDKTSGLFKILLRQMTTRWFLMLLFIPNLAYIILRFIYGHQIIDQWEEISELYPALGILLTIYINSLDLKRILRKSKQQNPKHKIVRK
jgi:hypothetical protein